MSSPYGSIKLAVNALLKKENPVRLLLTQSQRDLIMLECVHKSHGTTLASIAFGYFRDNEWPTNVFELRPLTHIQINEIIKNNTPDTNKVSDGYHTFGELYDHRIENFITVCKLIEAKDGEPRVIGSGIYHPEKQNIVWRSKNHSDGEPAFGGAWFVLGLFKEPGKQITYHLPISRWEDCSFACELPNAPEWDGHTSEDVLERLKSL